MTQLRWRTCLRLVVCGLVCGGGLASASSSTQTPGVTPAPRTLRVGTATVTITREDGADHVVAKSATGALESDSWCQIDEGTYDEYAAFFQAFQRAVNAHDVPGVTSLVRFPLRVNGPKRGTVASAPQLAARYAEVFTPKVVAAISAAEPGLVFCHEGAAMIASGAVWAGKDQGRIALDVVNP